MTRPIDLPSRIASLLLRGVLLLAGGVFALALLFAGLIAAVGLVLWALLRGRWPEMRMTWRMFRSVAGRRPFGPAGMRQASPSARRGGRADADVVDVEVREIPSARLPRQH